MSSIIEKISKYKIVPVIVIEKPEDSLYLGELLIKNNLPVAEVTFRSEAAAEGIALLKKEMPEIILGAGTLLTKESIDKAVDAGSDFFVSPGFNPVTVEYALSKNLNFLPGVSNPSLVEQAMNFGLKTLKFFPAEQAGGVGMLKAMSAVYPDISFMPTGGINLANINNYLALPNVIACGGSWMVKKDLITTHNTDQLNSLIAEAVQSV